MHLTSICRANLVQVVAMMSASLYTFACGICSKVHRPILRVHLFTRPHERVCFKERVLMDFCILSTRQLIILSHHWFRLLPDIPCFCNRPVSDCQIILCDCIWSVNTRVGVEHLIGSRDTVFSCYVDKHLADGSDDLFVVV